MSTRLRNALDLLALRLANVFVGRLRRQKAGDDPYHRVFAHFRQMVLNAPHSSLLEIGSRNVSGVDGRKNFPGVQDYTGVDIHAGEFVDVVADVHSLSSAFPEKRFDFVYSISVFEHLMFPWKAVLEINSVLKPGGHVFMATHPIWPPHELPWDFWRFLHHSAIPLFNKVTGFELVAVTEGLPARMFTLAGDPVGQDLYKFPLNQGIAIIARKIADYDRDRLRWDLVPSDVSDTMYPKPG
ncbi:MAG: class I SAM-dependent methyltransferase [Xanthomonadales bacterium]|nr:class I SAM-dependent methyltransferase [Xanthomonadales bacterium]